MKNLRNGVWSNYVAVVSVLPANVPLTKEEREQWKNESDIANQCARYATECGAVVKRHISEITHA